MNCLTDLECVAENCQDKYTMLDSNLEYCYDECNTG